MALAIITPTRQRWHWLARQAAALAPQLSPDDRWIIGVDNDQPDERHTERIRELVGDRMLIWAHFCYERPEPPVGVVNRLRNSLVSFAEPEANIVELDDHDIAAKDALAEIRHAFEVGNEFVFSWHHSDCLLEAPTGELLLEPWPDYRPHYTAGGFARGDCQPCGIRAVKRELWNRLGGWSPDVWPEGNMHFCMRAESAGAKICCIEKPLCRVLIDPDGISTRYRKSKWLEPTQAE